MGSNSGWTHFTRLLRAARQYLKKKKIEIWLSVDVYSRIIQAGEVKGRPDEPAIALKTKLGWLLSGSTCQHRVKQAGILIAIPSNTKLKEFVLRQRLPKAQVRGLCMVGGLRLRRFLTYK